MRHALLGLCLAACSTSRSQPLDAATSVSPPVASSAAPIESSAPSDAAAPLAECFEPSRVTQLGTIKNQAVFWRDDLVFDGTSAFDPETLASVPTPVRTTPISRERSDLLLTGERVEQMGTTLVAGARKVAKLAKGERFDFVANKRFIVVSAADVETDLHLIDGLTGKRDARTYIAVGDDLVAFQDEVTGITVRNISTHAIILKDIGPCAAGGTWTWSISPRFLWCDSNRGGRTGYDLHTGKAFEVGQSAFTSPDERYVVRVPGVGWGSNLISEGHAEWTSADTGRTVTLTKDVPHATEDTEPLTSTMPVAFCGTGKLFAIVTKRDLEIHRGADGKRLAVARSMPGGALEFSKSGRWILDKRAGAATVYRLEP
jgi:hypothetical protein